MEQPRSRSEPVQHRACDPCRKRKVRCSRHTPLCERCSYFSLVCDYSPMSTMGRPRRQHQQHQQQMQTQTQTIERRTSRSAATARTAAPSTTTTTTTTTTASPSPMLPTTTMAEPTGFLGEAAVVGADFPAMMMDTSYLDSMGIDDDGGTSLLPFSLDFPMDGRGSGSGSGGAGGGAGGGPGDSLPISDIRGTSLVGSPNQRVEEELESNSDQDDSSNGCLCAERVNEHFARMAKAGKMTTTTTTASTASTTSTINTGDAFATLHVLQQSMQAARQVLGCRWCAGMDNDNDSNKKKESIMSSAATSRNNVFLLGSLLSSIGAAYGDVFYDQKKRADMAGKSQLFGITVGSTSSSSSSTVDLTVDAASYVVFLRACLKQELDRLQQLGDGLAARQRRLHARGHEQCAPETGCSVPPPPGEGGGGRSGEGSSTRPLLQHPAELCPQEVDMTQACACFRTVDQVSAVITEAQRIIMA